jgi:hypothetical protein
MSRRPVRCATEGQSTLHVDGHRRWWRTRVPQRSDDARPRGSGATIVRFGARPLRPQGAGQSRRPDGRVYEAPPHPRRSSGCIGCAASGSGRPFATMPSSNCGGARASQACGRRFVQAERVALPTLVPRKPRMPGTGPWLSDLIRPSEPRSASPPSRHRAQVSSPTPRRSCPRAPSCELNSLIESQRRPRGIVTAKRTPALVGRRSGCLSQ